MRGETFGMVRSSDPAAVVFSFFCFSGNSCAARPIAHRFVASRTSRLESKFQSQNGAGTNRCVVPWESERAREIERGDKPLLPGSFAKMDYDKNGETSGEGFHDRISEPCHVLRSTSVPAIVSVCRSERFSLLSRAQQKPHLNEFSAYKC